MGTREKAKTLFYPKDEEMLPFTLFSLHIDSKTLCIDNIIKFKRPQLHSKEFQSLIRRQRKEEQSNEGIVQGE